VGRRALVSLPAFLGALKTRRTLTLVVKRTRTQSNEHERGVWVGRITKRLKKAGVEILLGQF
jgi:hypothetical protein